MGVDAAEGGDGVRHGQELTARQWRMVERDMGKDAFLAGYSTRDMAGETPQESTWKHAVPEIGTPLVWRQVVSPRGYTQVRDPTTGAPLLERRLEPSELEPREIKEQHHHSGLRYVQCPVERRGLGMPTLVIMRS